MDKRYKHPSGLGAAAFGNSNNIGRYEGTTRGRNTLKKRNYETRGRMGGPGRRNHNRSRSRNRRPLNLPGLTSNYVENSTEPNYLSAIPNRPFNDPLKRYNNATRARAAFNRGRGPSMPRNNTRRRPFNRDPSLGRTNASPEEARTVRHIANSLTKIMDKYEERYIANKPRYIFAYSSDFTNALGMGSQLNSDGSGAYVYIHIPRVWQRIMEKYYKTIHVHSVEKRIANLKTLRTHSYSADEVKTAIRTSHFNV